MSAGQLNQLSFKKEATWGTAVVPDKSIPVHFSGGISTDNDIQFINGARAILSKNLDSFIGKRSHEGEFEIDLFADYPAYFFLGALGAVSSALKSGETLVYEHTITEQELKPSFTIEQVVGENVRRFAGSLISGFKVIGKMGESTQLSFSVKAKSQTAATKINPSYGTAKAFNWANTVLKIGGTTLAGVSSFELEYSNNLELLYSLNSSNDPQYSYVKGSEVKGKIECYLDSTSLTELTDYLAKTAKALDIEMMGDVIGSATNNKIAISVPKIIYTSAVTELSENYNLLKIEFEGVYDTATSKLISMVVTNLLTNLS
jgi:hypothetical protein